MALRARKVSGAFEKRPPGDYGVRPFRFARRIFFRPRWEPIRRLTHEAHKPHIPKNNNSDNRRNEFG